MSGRGRSGKVERGNAKGGDSNSGRDREEEEEVGLRRLKLLVTQCSSRCMVG